MINNVEIECVNNLSTVQVKYIIMQWLYIKQIKGMFYKDISKRLRALQLRG